MTCLGLNQINIKQGTDKSFLLKFRDSEWEAIDITDYKIFFVVRKKSTLADNDNENLVINKLAVIEDWTTGEATININDSDTKNVEIWKYIYEISYRKPEDTKHSHYGYGDFEIAYLSNKM